MEFYRKIKIPEEVIERSVEAGMEGEYAWKRALTKSPKARPTTAPATTQRLGTGALELTRFRRRSRYAATVAAACCLSKSIGLT
jgi:hypothetical protein